eukprot:TRINITY_DN27148_c0_g3_i2.p1 TRINITY_DN27148_c0_g3~~TRINITY_DN27148_c0_g3_i2.p1  ORF type:complete len:342 (+),score=110.64 TRINITY_DN27148_c0_g3_i2:54-1079(+)
MQRYLTMSDEEIAASPIAQGGLNGVPMVDISELIHAPHPTAGMQCVRDISAACREWGFFQVVGHGVEQSLLDEAVRVSHDFFSLPKAEKGTVKRKKDNSKGWFDDELTKQKVDWKEGFDYGTQDGVMDKSGLDGQNQWPSRDIAPDLERVAKDYFAEVRLLSLKLLSAMAVGLGLPHDQYTRHFDRDTSFARLNYYPRCPDPSSHWSISHHTDAGAVTVLYQPRVKSLQVFNLTDRMWYEVEPVAHAFVINTGDIMQVWSNDIYRAPLHRVKAQAAEQRYSIPFFLNPSYDTDYAPSVSGGPPLYRPINWGVFRMARFGGDYADVGTDTQIAHYRIKQAKL